MESSQPGPREDRRRRIGVALLLVSAAGLRLWQLGSQSLWFDEHFTLSIASLPAGEFVGELITDTQHPPLYYLIVKCFFAFGINEVTARLPSVLFGVVAVWLTWRLGWMLAGAQAAWVAAAWMALSPFQVYYSQEARMYTLFVCAALAAWWALLVALREGGAGAWVRYAIAQGAALSVSYLTLGLSLSHLLYLVTTERRRQRWSGWAAVHAVVYGLYVPWFLLLSSHAERLTPGRGNLANAWSALLGGWLDFVCGYFQGLWRTPSLWGVAFAASAVAVALAFCGVAHARRLVSTLSVSPQAVMVCGVVGPLVFGFALAVATHFHQTRYLAAAQPWVLLLLSCGMVRLESGRRPAGWVVAVCLAALNIAALRNYFCDAVSYHRDDWRGAAEYCREAAQPDDVFVFNARWMREPFDYYYPEAFETVDVSDTVPARRAQVEQSVARLVESRPGRIWLLLCYEEISDPHGYVLQALQERRSVLVHRDFPGIRVYLFAAARHAAERNASGRSIDASD